MGSLSPLGAKGGGSSLVKPKAGGGLQGRPRAAPSEKLGWRALRELRPGRVCSGSSPGLKGRGIAGRRRPMADFEGHPTRFFNGKESVKTTAYGL